ncbi:proP [Symbiodinium pilosum]|uniref:ProP protein n=1 Tax=Symbiodinium pilosum TaxID=2952 RepID=A0A812WTA0_SYMPI|nr:proP [Symbiodinium pilosum]
MEGISDVAQVFKVYWALLLGNILEWYEFAIYSFLEPYLEINFFGGSAISTWLGFACTFAARPFGGIVLGLLGDLFGRKVSTFLSICGMIIGTVGQGLVPSFQSGKVAGTIGLVLLVLLRLLQGICTGGEIAAVSTYITEVGPKRSLARSMALIGITANAGFLLAQLASYLTREAVGVTAMENWAWRIPFIIAIIPGAVATAGRRCIPESQVFLEAKAQADATAQVSETSWDSADGAVSVTVVAVPAEGAARQAMTRIKHLIASQWLALLVGIGSVAGVSVLQYGGFLWGNVFLKKHGATPDSLIAAGTTARLLSIVLAPFVAWLADTVGIGWIQLVGTLVLTFAGLPLFLVQKWMPDSFSIVIAAYGIGYGTIFGLVGMIFFLLVVELFPVEVRNAGVGLSYNIGFCFFGGFAPTVFQAALSWHPWGPGWLMSFAGLASLLTFAASIWLQAAGKGNFRLAHIRVLLYSAQKDWPSSGESDDLLNESQSILFSEVFSSFLETASTPQRKGPKPKDIKKTKDSKDVSTSKDSGAREKGEKDSLKACEWSPILNVQRKFCKHQQRQYSVQVAADLLKGEPFGKLRRKGYGAMMRNPPLSLPSAVSAQFGFPSDWLTSRSSCNDVARRRNLAPTVERFPALRSSGVRPPLGDLDEIDAADEAAAWSASARKVNDRREVREPAFKIDRPWLSGARRPRLLERAAGGLCEAADDAYLYAAAPKNRGLTMSMISITGPSESPSRTPTVTMRPDEPRKSIKSKIKEAMMNRMSEQIDVVQDAASQVKDSRRQRADDEREVAFKEAQNQADASDEAASKSTGLWRLHHKESKRSRLSRITTCRRLKETDGTVAVGYRDRVNRYEAEAAQECFLRYFSSKSGNAWSADDIIEALADFGIKAASRSEKLALKSVLSEYEGDEIGFNNFCSIIEEARSKLRSTRSLAVFQAWKYADKEDAGGLHAEAVMQLLEDLQLASEKDSLERQYVEAMVSDCRPDPATGLIGLSEVEFLFSAVREYMMQCQRSRERELQAEYGLSGTMFQEFRSQLIKFHESFQELDDDDSGELDENEAMNLLTHFGCLSNVSSMPVEKKMQAQAIIEWHLNESEDHTLSFPRFLSVVKHLRTLGMDDKMDVVESLFNQYDRDQSGKLTIKDVCQILMDLNIKPRSVLEQENMAQLIEEADSEGSGLLNVTELLLLVQRINERVAELDRMDILRKAQALNFTTKQANTLWETFEELDEDGEGLVPTGQASRLWQ